MAISNEWLEWTRSNLKQGSAPAEIRLILKQRGFSDKDIKYALKKALPRKGYQQALKNAALEEAHEGRHPDTDYEALANPRLVREADGEKVVCLSEKELQLYTIPNFLNDEQCDRLVEIISSHAYPSTVAVNEAQNQLRTSSTCDLAVSDHPYMAEIEEMISQALGLNLAWSEVNQGQWYAPGQEYKSHVDYFTPGTPEYARFASAQGQRSWTFMIYLNEPESGGGTRFTKINKTLMPEKGRAVCWNSLRRDGQPNPLSEHCGMPVEAGSKFIITKWFKDRGKGPALLG